MENLRLLTLFAAFMCFTFSVSTIAQIQLQPVLSGLSSPLLVTNAKDGTNRLFVVEQGGTIKVLQPNQTAPTQFVNISSKIVAGGERGLLGLAFHPQFLFNRKFYVNYTRAADGATVIAEYLTLATNPNQGDASSERILLVIPQPFTNHNGGMIEFGKDGFLYIGMGDGGSGNDPQNNAQNRSRLLGKFLRIDVNVAAGSNVPYLIPADNPFQGANTSRCDGGSTTNGITCQEIFAIGLRNPFRWSFDRNTGALYAGDVGQNAIEEIDIINSAQNYGWRVYEGTNCTNVDPSLCNSANYVAPIYEYAHASGRCSTTGGYVYRGRRGTLPVGTYLFSDYCTGEIMTQGAQPRTPNVLLDTSRNVSSFGEDEAGELYVVGVGGTVEKIVNPNAVTSRNQIADYDGDLRTDISVFRPSDSVLYSINSGDSSTRATQFGFSSDTVTPADFDGDGKTDVAVWRPADGVWYSLNSSNNAFRAFQWGLSGDIPVAGDYDGDRTSDYAVWRPSDGVWYIWQSSTNSFRAVQFGINSDQPVPADYDGDGKTDIAVRRASENVWYVLRSSDNNLFTAQWGLTTDIPVTGDFDGDGKADVAVWRPDDGTWYALRSDNQALYVKQWGLSGDMPVAGDYDGDGKTDPAVTRDTDNGKVWYVTGSLNPAVYRIVQFGVATDIAVPAKDVP